MQIRFTPQRRDDALTLSRAGDVLTINGTAYDFTPLPEGALLPRAAVDCGWLASDVTRTGGQIQLTLILPHGPLPVPAPAAAAVITHPAPIHVTGDGPVALPHWAPPADSAEGTTA